MRAFGGALAPAADDIVEMDATAAPEASSPSAACFGDEGRVLSRSCCASVSVGKRTGPSAVAGGGHEDDGGGRERVVAASSTMTSSACLSTNALAAECIHGIRRS